MARYTRGRKLEVQGGLKPQKPARISGNNNSKVKKQTIKNTDLKELQDILNIKTEQQQQPRNTGYVQQNTQFARENSSLRTKITELELKLNDLLKENLQLRHNNVSNKIQYELHLNEQITLLENGVFQRFDEIILMFDNVRKRENLPPNKSAQWLKYHQQKVDTSNAINKTILTPANKRNRRKSTFIPSDDLPLIDKPLHNENVVHNSSVSETVIHESSIPILEHPDNVSKEEIEFDEQNNISLQDNIENSISGTSSVLDCPIPEEKEEEVKNDSDVNKLIHIANTSTESLKATSTPPVSNTQEIKKKTQRKRTTKIPPPIIKNTKKKIVSKDDKMPQTNIDVKKIEPTIKKSTEEDPVPEGRSFRRSTRGKVVNYKLPSLRAKMRRPKEQLVDATTINNIHEYEVNVKTEPQVDVVPHKVTPVKIEPACITTSKLTTSCPSKKTKPKRKTIEKTATEQDDKIPNDLLNDSANNTSNDSTDNTSNDIITIPVLKRKTSVYSDPDADSIDFFLADNNDADLFSTPTVIQSSNKNGKKRGRNSLLDDDDDEKENANITKSAILSPKKDLKHRHAFNLKVNKNIISSSPLMSSKLSSSSNNNNSSSQILSDITNTTKPNKIVTKKPKKKLLKRAIINDLYNDAEDLDIYDSLNKKSPSPSLSSSSSASFRSLSSSFHYQGNSAKSEKEGKTVSFRFSDDDLSVFDLVDKHRNNKKSKAKATGQ